MVELQQIFVGPYSLTVADVAQSSSGSGATRHTLYTSGLADDATFSLNWPYGASQVLFQNLGYRVAYKQPKLLHRFQPNFARRSSVIVHREGGGRNLLSTITLSKLVDRLMSRITGLCHAACVLNEVGGQLLLRGGVHVAYSEVYTAAGLVYVHVRRTCQLLVACTETTICSSGHAATTVHRWHHYSTSRY